MALSAEHKKITLFLGRPMAIYTSTHILFLNLHFGTYNNIKCRLYSQRVLLFTTEASIKPVIPHFNQQSLQKWKQEPTTSR